MKRHTYGVLALATAVLTVVAAGAAPALATDGATGAEGRTCTVEVQPLAPGQNPATLPEAEPVCYDSTAEALQSVTGVPVSQADADGVSHERLAALVERLNTRVADRGATATPRLTHEVKAGATGATIDAASPLALGDDAVLGIGYSKTFYLGNTIVFWGKTPYGCQYGASYGFPRLSAYSWDNTLSSMDTFAWCWSTLYDDITYKGTRINCTKQCYQLGILDNRVSSVVFRPTGTLG